MCPTPKEAQLTQHIRSLILNKMEDSDSMEMQPLPPELLLKIFEKVRISSENKYQDLVSCQSACSNWKKILTGNETVNWLIEQVLPHIFPYFSRSEFLALRQVSTIWRHAVDQFRSKTPLKIAKPMYFHAPARPNAPTQIMDRFWNEMPIINPFIDRNVVFTSHYWDDYYEPEHSAERFLARFSQQFRFLTFYFDDHSYICTSYYRNLIRLLQRALPIPNLNHIDVNIAAGRELDVNNEDVVEILNEYPFPEVTTLKSFAFAYDSWGDPSPLLEPILQSISGGLTSVKIIARVYVILERLDELQFITSLNFPRLTQLDIALEQVQSVERILIWLGSSPQESPLESLTIYVYAECTLGEIQALFSACKLFSKTLESINIKVRTKKKDISLAISELKKELSRCKNFNVANYNR